MKKHIPMILTTVLLTVILLFLESPALTIHSPDLVIFLAATTIFGIAVISILDLSFNILFNGKIVLRYLCYIPIPLAILTFYLIGSFLSEPMFAPKHLSDSSTYETVDFTDDISKNDTISNITFISLEPSKMLGERILGEFPELASIYDVDEKYTAIYLNGKPMKIAPLKYKNASKYFKNSSLGIPGYVLVDTTNNTSKYVATEKPIKYSPSAGGFDNNLKRHLWHYNPTKIYGKALFEIDEEGKCYWITPVFKTQYGLYGGYVVEGFVITDAVTGANTYYAPGDIPEWVDIITDGSAVYN